LNHGTVNAADFYDEILVMGSGYTDYRKENAEIEKAYKNGEITKDQYLNLRRGNRQAYLETWTQEAEIKK
jgi:hypothetical protein